MSEETKSALAPIVPPQPPPPTAVASFDNVFGIADRPTFASFDMTTLEGRQLLQKCEEEPDTEVREMANMTFNLVNFYGRVFDFTNPQTSETYPLLRICLVTDEGKVHATCSDGVRESIFRLVRGHGQAPWKQPIPVRVLLKSLGGNKQRMTLLEVFASKEKKK